MLKDRLKKSRIAKGLSQAELAALANCTQGIIQKIEGGHVKGSSFLVDIAKVLDVSAEWLLHGNLPNLTLDEKTVVQILPVLTIRDVLPYLLDGTLPTDYRRASMLLGTNRVSSKSFLIEIQGDAMVSTENPAKSIFPGELAIVDPELAAKIGDIVLAQITQKDIKVRQYIIDGEQSILKAFSTNYPFITMTENSKILGVVVGSHKFFMRSAEH